MHQLKQLIALIDGNKTYVVGIVGAIIDVLIVFGVIVLTQEQFITIQALILALFGITFRSALNKV